MMEVLYHFYKIKKFTFQYHHKSRIDVGGTDGEINKPGPASSLTKNQYSKSMCLTNNHLADYTILP